MSNIIKESKKPIIILGKSVLLSSSGKYIFESIKYFLKKNNKISNEWNSFNIVSENASTVGSFDLGIFQTNDGSNQILSNLQSHKYELVFLLGQDSIKFKKQNTGLVWVNPLP